MDAMGSAYMSAREVGALIAELRQRAGLGQAEVGARLGIDQSAMSRIERGQRSLSAWELYALADLFEVDPDRILRKEEDSGVLLRAGGAGDAAIRRGLEAFETLTREILAARALEELL
jgi:transcriptional regulator with XRE-family HTH domain